MLAGDLTEEHAGMELEGIAWILVLALDALAIVTVAGSALRPATKTVWLIAIAVLPLAGVAIWWLAGPMRSRLRHPPSPGGRDVIRRR